MRRRARVNDNSPARSEHLRSSRLILILAEIDVGKRLSVRGVRRGMVYRFRMEDDRTSVSMMRTTSLTIGSPASSVHSSTSILTVDGDFWARRLSAITCRSDAVNLRLPAIMIRVLRHQGADTERQKAPLMSTYRLKSLFAPRAIAVVGASPRELSLGRIVLENLRGAGFKGPVHLVNPGDRRAGHRARYRGPRSAAGLDCRHRPRVRGP